MNADSSVDLFGLSSWQKNDECASSSMPQQQQQQRHRLSFGPLESSVNLEVFDSAFTEQALVQPAALTAPVAAAAVVVPASVTTVEPVQATSVLADESSYALRNFVVRGHAYANAKLVLRCPSVKTFKLAELKAMTFEQHLDAAIHGKLASSVSLRVRSLLARREICYALYTPDDVIVATNLDDWPTVGTHFDLQAYWSAKHAKTRSHITAMFGPTEANQAGVFTTTSTWMTHEDNAQKITNMLAAGTMTVEKLATMKIASYTAHDIKAPRAQGVTVSRRSSSELWTRVVTPGAAGTPAQLTRFVADGEREKKTTASTVVAVAAAAPKKSKKRAHKTAAYSDDEDEEWKGNDDDDDEEKPTKLKSTLTMADLYSPAFFEDECTFTTKRTRTELTFGGTSETDTAQNNLIDILASDTDGDLLLASGTLGDTKSDQWLINNMLSSSLLMQPSASLKSAHVKSQHVATSVK